MSENQPIPIREPRIRVQYAESRLMPIWDCLCSILKDPDNVIPRLEEYTFKSVSKSFDARKRIAEAEKHIELLIQKRSRIVKVFTDGRMTDKEYDRDSKECDSSIAEFHQQIAKHKQLLIQRDERKDRNEILKKHYEKIKTRLENATYEDKTFILHLFVERINLFHQENYAEVVFKFPASTQAKLDDVTKLLSPDNMCLVLHVKTLSERDRRHQLLLDNITLPRKDKIASNMTSVNPATLHK